jgi:hypothetical protein
MASFQKRSNIRSCSTLFLQTILMGWLLSGLVLIVVLMRQLSYDDEDRRLGEQMTENRINLKQYQSALISQQNSCRRMKTVDDVRLCYPNHIRQNHHRRNNCNNITTFESAQRCLTGKLSDTSIREIHIGKNYHHENK